ncbi:MAG: aconitate hydratase [Pseudomonadota bacterium]
MSGKNVARKILESHIVEGKWAPGEEIAIRIDQTLTQDATGTMAYLQFEAMGLPRVKTELSVSYIDHNTIQIGYENADDHKYLQGVASKYGIFLSRAGNGICHQVHLERFGKPGKTLLGSDSHTPTGGGIGMIAMGAGGLDVAVAMGGGSFYLTCPRVVKIHLTGKLSPWVAAKDVVLKVLEIFSTKGNVSTIFEYGGPGVASLTVPERATITNMGAECGVTTSVFPSDGETLRFLKAQARGSDWVELLPDADAAYDRVVEIDLGAVEPMAAAPHSPGNIKTVREIAGIAVDQVAIGSCTNSSYVDLTTAARILKGKTINPAVSLIIAPGSRQVLTMLTKEGSLFDLLSAGARLAENTCGFCIGNSQSPKSDAVSIRTSNRNFLGRSGTKSAQAYLVSCETAAAAALTGKLTDPRTLDMEYPVVAMPDSFLVDDSMIVAPSAEPESVTIVRGPNIGDPPVNGPLPDTLDAKVGIHAGDEITTDHIIPAGARMKYRSNVPKYSEYLFEIYDPDFYGRAKAIKEEGLQDVFVAGLSYGQGSSREHAALCPMYMQVKAVITKSFERIHMANLVNFGIVPFVFADVADYERVQQGDRLQIVNLRSCIAGDGKALVKNLTQGTEFGVTTDLSERASRVVLAGGMLNYIKEQTA